MRKKAFLFFFTNYHYSPRTLLCVQFFLISDPGIRKLACIIYEHAYGKKLDLIYRFSWLFHSSIRNPKKVNNFQPCLKRWFASPGWVSLRKCCPLFFSVVWGGTPSEFSTRAEAGWWGSGGRHATGYANLLLLYCCLSHAIPSSKIQQFEPIYLLFYIKFQTKYIIYLL